MLVVGLYMELLPANLPHDGDAKHQAWHVIRRPLNPKPLTLNPKP